KGRKGRKVEEVGRRGRVEALQDDSGLTPNQGSTRSSPMHAGDSARVTQTRGITLTGSNRLRRGRLPLTVSPQPDRCQSRASATRHPRFGGRRRRRGTSTENGS